MSTLADCSASHTKRDICDTNLRMIWHQCPSVKQSPTPIYPGTNVWLFLQIGVSINQLRLVSNRAYWCQSILVPTPLTPIWRKRLANGHQRPFATANGSEPWKHSNSGPQLRVFEVRETENCPRRVEVMRLRWSWRHTIITSAEMPPPLRKLHGFMTVG